MEILNSIEEKLKSSIDINKLEQEVKDCFAFTVKSIEENDVGESLYNVLGSDAYLCEFAGVTLHLMNAFKRKPFFRIKLFILNERNKDIVAWYEVEYGSGSEILDDYFGIL